MIHNYTVINPLLPPPPSCTDTDHEESIYYQMEPKRSSLKLSPQDGQAKSSLDQEIRYIGGEDEGESSLDKGTRTPVLCTRG